MKTPPGFGSDLKVGQSASKSGQSFAEWQAQSAARNLNPSHFSVQTDLSGMKRRDPGRRGVWISIHSPAASAPEW